MEIEQRIYNGNRAREVLENEAYQDAIESLKQEIVEQWKQSPARDEAGREKLWSLLKMADKLEAILRTTLETGKLAELDLNHRQTLMDRAKSFAGMG